MNMRSVLAHFIPIPLAALLGGALASAFAWKLGWASMAVNATLGGGAAAVIVMAFLVIQALTEPKKPAPANRAGL